MDVVPVYPEKWTHPPFSADMDEEGRIFARGSQDMKCVGMQYLAAIRALKRNGIQALKRTIHVTFAPDEEIGGHNGGMEDFVQSDEFKNLKVGLTLDEGVAGANESYPIFYAERSIWQINFKITGNAGHAALLLKNTVGQKLLYLMNKMMEFRAQEEQRLENDSNLLIGDITTVNLTMLKGGVQSNVVPSIMEACFDLRLSIRVNHDDFEKQLRKWCDEAGGGIELDFEQKQPKVPATRIDASNLYWLAFKKAIDDLDLKTSIQVCPGGTDSRYVRAVGIPAFGFSPMNNTPVLLHDHDEFLKADTYLRDPCITFLANQARSLELDYKIYNAHNEVKKPILILTWTGSQPELSSILLNSHMDVVPVFPENWTHPPFAAEMDDKGRIFARGSQDMKSVGIQYLAAIRSLKKSGIKSLNRTIHITFVPDEEITGQFGMSAFVKSTDFHKLNIGFALDEGIATPGDEFSAFYAERSIWQINFKISGTAGHGSMLLNNTAGEKLNYILNKLMTFRAEQSQCLEEDLTKHIGEVSTVNLTRINGGVQPNVVPPMLEACFDMRLAINLDLTDFEEKINRWCAEAGGEIDIEWIVKLNAAPPTKLDQSNIFWTAFQSAAKQLKIHVEALVFPGGTDIQYIRDMGIPAIGFSPMNNTPILLHDHDEFLGAETFLRGIEIYVKLIQELGNVQ